eukprot:13174980-Alexandrium_andersonii.AAC.1
MPPYQQCGLCHSCQCARNSALGSQAPVPGRLVSRARGRRRVPSGRAIAASSGSLGAGTRGPVPAGDRSKREWSLL